MVGDPVGRDVGAALGALVGAALDGIPDGGDVGTGLAPLGGAVGGGALGAGLADRRPGVAVGCGPPLPCSWSVAGKELALPPPPLHPATVATNTTLAKSCNAWLEEL